MLHDLFFNNPYIRRNLKTAFGFTIRIFITSLFIIAILCGGFVFFNIFSGYRNYAVISASMSPMLNKGDLIFIKELPFEQLCVDDVITFRQPDSNAVVTHRVNRIDNESRKVYTIGDQNRFEDYDPVDAENIKGIYIYKIPKIGKWFK